MTMPSRGAVLAHKLAEQDGVCWLCKKRLDLSQATRDHIIPRYHGGTSAAWNIAAAHKRCNDERGHAPPGFKKVLTRIITDTGVVLRYEIVPITVKKVRT